MSLKSLKPYLRLRRFGLPHDRAWTQRLFVADPEPVANARGLRRRIDVRQARLCAVADEEEIAEHLDLVALLAFAEQRRQRQAHVLAEQVEQRALDGGDDVDRRPQIERLQSAPARVAVGKRLAHAGEDRKVVADRAALDQRARVLQRLADLLPARHLADAGVPGAVGEDQQVAREVRRVRAGQVQQHSVASRDGHHAQRTDDRRRRPGGGR